MVCYGKKLSINKESFSIHVKENNMLWEEILNKEGKFFFLWNRFNDCMGRK